MSLTVVKTDPIDPHMQLLGTLYLVLRKVRLHGLMSIEEDIERPEESEAFSGVSGYDTANEPVYTFVRDVLRLMVGGNLNSEEIARYMDAYRKTTDLSEIQTSMFEVGRLTLLAAMEGYAPQVAVEFGRQGIPAAVKPEFVELENFVREITRRPVSAERDIKARLNEFFDSIGDAK